MPIFNDNSYNEYATNGQLNFIGICNKYFDIIARKTKQNEETQESYKSNFKNLIFPRINVGKAAIDYDEDDLMDLVDRSSKGYEASTRNRNELLITRSFNEFVNDPSVPGTEKFWGTYCKYYSNNQGTVDENVLKKIRKSFRIEEEKLIYNILLTHPETLNGELVGLAIMFLTAIRNNESAGLNFGDIKTLKEHSEVHYIQVYETTEINTNKLKPGGKTRNAIRKLPLIDCLYIFLMERKSFIINELINSGITKEEAERKVLNMPIACRGKHYETRCSSIDLSNAGREFLRVDLKFDEDEYSGLSYCRLKCIGTNGILESDTTTYLLRRNMATHLYALGFSTLQSQYYMGHNMENTPLKRSDFNDEEFLYDIYKLLQNHPLNRINNPVTKLDNKSKLIENNISNININLNSNGHCIYQLNIQNNEIQNDIRIKFNGDINNITINKAISPKGFEQEINITSEVKKVYNK